MKDKLKILREVMTECGTPVPSFIGKTNVAEFMKDFFITVSKIRSYLIQIQTSHVEIEKLHNGILSSPEQNKEEKDELELLMESVKRNTENVRVMLKNIEKEITTSYEYISDNQSAEFRIKQTQHSALLRVFTDLMTRYNLSQVEFRTRCKERIKRQLSIANRQIEDDELEDLIEQDKVAIFTQEIVTETEQAKKTLADVEARHEDILKLERSIRDLHDIFVDMLILIESQGEVIDRIEFNVAKSRDYVAKAVIDTQKAVSYQSDTRRKKCVIIIIIVAVILVVIAAIVGGVLHK